MKSPGRGQCGVSLAEALVAITVLALASTAALMVYSGARRSYKVGSNLTEQQQNVRIAFDELTEDLRLAGFNVNPDGNGQRPDEQIELAQDTAIVLRADFDAADASASVVPEETLADTSSGAAFFTVSTGNDEIRAYVLANEASSETLDFEADLSAPVRDGEVEAVAIEGISLTLDDPPYTLYRVSWDESGGEVREPMIDQISALRFVYYDERGQVLAPVPGADDANGVNELARAAIRRIGLEVEGMTRDPDPRWVDPAAPAAVSGHQRFDLAADVTPRNLGLFGVPDLEAYVQPPMTPPPPSLYEGHCGGLWAEWSPNPPQDEVARYELYWGTQEDDISNGPIYAATAEVYLDGLEDDTTYFVTVTAVDDSGAPSQPSPPASATTTNLNIPGSVTEVEATQDLEGLIVLSWGAVTENEVPPFVPAQDPHMPEMRDAGGYAIYRKESPPDFVSVPGEESPSHHPGPSHDDTHVVNCRTYYYRVRAMDQCDRVGAESAIAVGRSVYSTAPLAPVGVQAFWAGQVNASPVNLEWSPVTQDVDGEPIFIKNYTIHRAIGPPGLTSFGSLSFSSVHEELYGSTSWQDTSGAHTAYYYVTTHDDCINESEPSEIVSAQCNFVGEVALDQPMANQTVPNGPVWLQAHVDAGAGAYSITFRVTSFTTGQLVHQQVTPSPGQSLWDATGDSPGSYRIDAVATQQLNGCEEMASIFVQKNP